MVIKTELRTLFFLFLVLVALPLFLHTNQYVMQILVMCLIWSVVAASWDLIMGFAGIFSFGQVAFFVLGGYGGAILTEVLGISPWFGILLGGCVAGLVGILVGLPCLRLKGPYVALVTFAFHMLLEPLLKSDIGRALGSGGTQGLLGITPFSLGGYEFSSLEMVPWYYTALILSFISFLVIYKIIHSTWGLAFVALRDAEVFAKSLGVNDFKYKLMVFGLSAFLAGAIGAFYGTFVGVLSTRILGLDVFLTLMVMLVVGGIGRFPGALIGALLVSFVSEMLRPAGVYRGLIFGAMVVLLILLLPQGITGLLSSSGKAGRWLQRLRGREGVQTP
jgi:branched-chain amino acid transport system permease protein